jgi:hypothetical protein
MMSEKGTESASLPLANSTHEDLSVATDLIVEYTQRLLTACHSVTRQQMRRLTIASFLWVLVLAGAGGLFVGSDLLSSVVAIRTSLLLGIAGVVAGASVGWGFSARFSMLARDEVRLNARGLAVLVRYASSVYEHKSVGTSERLLLEVRLGEAGAALEIASRYGAGTREMAFKSVDGLRVTPLPSSSTIATLLGDK